MEIKDMLKSVERENNVRMHIGWAAHEELPFLYRSAGVFVRTSLYENFCLDFVEAMASSLLVMAGNRASIPEAVGDAGILLDPFDVDGFAYWMPEVLINEDLRAELSEAGYKRSLNFSWEKCAEEALEVGVLNEQACI